MADRAQVLFSFPLVDPPPRSALRGLLLSVFGTTLIVVGMLGAGLAANGLVWSIIQLIFVLGGCDPHLPGQGLLLPVAIVAIPLGILSSVYGFSEGPRLRERGRRLQARDARTSLDWRKEEPVLLLRSFEDEQIPDPRPLICGSAATKRVSLACSPKWVPSLPLVVRETISVSVVQLAWNLTRRKYQSMEEERIQRYHNFRKRCASFLDEPLPIQLETSLFLEFLPCGEARLLRGRIRPWWHYLFPITGANIMVDLLVPRHRRRLRFDMRHTLKPFVVKAMSLRARRRETN